MANRILVRRGFSYWQNAGSFVVWFEAGKDWAHDLIDGNIWERMAREAVLNLMAPGFGTAMDLVLHSYRNKLKKYIGPNGIWVAVKVLDPQKPARMPLPLVYAKKRTEANMQKAPDPWEPPNGNIFPG